MSRERRVLRRAAQLVALARELQEDGLGGASRSNPMFWPGLTAGEAAAEWEALRVWVEQLRARFPNAIRLPDCWWRHNDLVEVLSALRDFERGCFAETAPASGAVDWHRALRDMEARMDVWVKRFTCGVSGRGHDTPAPILTAVPGWTEFVDQDVQRRPHETDRGDIVSPR